MFQLNIINMKKLILLLSILVNSNNKENLSKFLDSYETNAKNPKCFEVIVNIDEGDELMINFIKSEINKKKEAEAILNALRDKEKINQKFQIKKAVSRKMEKDW